MKDPCNLTPAEFELVEILWEAEGRPLAVSQVHSALQRRRSLAYTTVMTVLDKLARRKTLERTKRGKAYLYRPRVQRHEVMVHLLRQFSLDYCEGDSDRLLEYLPSNGGRRSRKGSRESPGPRRSTGAPGLDAADREDSEDLDVCLL